MKNKIKKSVVISQIIILLVSIIAFSYFVGSEFRVVNALSPVPIPTTKSTIKALAPSESGSDLSGLERAEQTETTSIQVTGEVTRLGGGGARGVAEPGGRRGGAIGESVGKNIGQVGGNAFTAAGIYAGLRGFFSQVDFLDPSIEKAISAGVSIGVFASMTLKDLGINAILGISAPVIGLIVAVVIFAVFAKDVKYDLYSFTCYPWDAPLGGQYCDRCNKGGLPCTEYQCESLGQACELVNKGTTEELCIWKNRDDVTPPIMQPWQQILTTGYKYIPDSTTSPPNRGWKIVPETNDNGCVAPFIALRFGVTLNKAGKCKVDFSNKNNFDTMEHFLSEGRTRYNHSFQTNIQSPDALEAEGITLANGGRFSIYFRCQDENGNPKGDSPSAFTIFKFCVDNGPDKRQPEIVTTSILNNSPIPFGQTSVNLQVYVNEPSECKWDRLDRAYDDMENQMTCKTGALEFNAQMLYQCATTLTGLIDRADNEFYFRCKDQPHLKGTPEENKRNTNKQSYKFTLKGTEPLVIDSAKPNSTTIKDSTDVIKVKLEVKTSAGYDEGKALCSYEGPGTGGNFNEFFNTGTHEHSQDLFLTAGDYIYDIQCIDLGGNVDTKTISFKVETDTIAPTVVRVFRQENSLKVITNEKAQCVYGNFGCDYLFKDGTNMTKAVNGTEHSTAWNTNKIFYIKCSDEFGNQPFPNACNIIAKPFEVRSD
ncbi:hypothetical protein J4422_02795 [Candidatus Pacearchaeota archaeon]|nr:hypothetical protein [Candidatus Pacearchaeota archaeon]